MISDTEKDVNSKNRTNEDNLWTAGCVLVIIVLFIFMMLGLEIVGFFAFKTTDFVVPICIIVLFLILYIFFGGEKN